jgi:signal transduction histidine kinase
VEAAAWRTPLVSGEISEFLPYWETAVILSDPSAFESRVRASRYALSALVLALFLSVAGGAVFLWRYSSARLLEAKRRTGFVTTVSHELKTPLTSIRMYSEMLAGGADLDRKKRDRYLAQIVGESERLTHLINDVLDVAKLERGKRRLVRVPLDIALVARETVEGIADRLKAAGFSVTFTANESPAPAMADKDAVVRILLNLLSNAEKYSGDSREIDVTVGFDEKRKVFFASVADRGIGVPRAHRKKIFREFHRVDATLTSEQGGTGLGLSIARALARSLGGDVRYAPRDRSGREKGSVFTLSLPAAEKKDGNQ